MSINSDKAKKKFSPKKGHKMQFGERGEQVAQFYLEQRKNMTLVEKNWRCQSGEIDLIMMDENTLCFIEVRSKMGYESGHPLETITATKQKQIVRVAMHYLQQKNLEDSPIRFDAVGIVKEGSKNIITHIPAAFDGWML